MINNSYVIIWSVAYHEDLIFKKLFYMKKFLLFLLGITFFSATANAQEFVYPLQEISKPNCRFQKFSELSSSCKQKFPKLKTSDYDKLKNDYDYRRIYTVLWTWTYTYGWDVWNWSHLWVDIATSEGTPVYSITDWTVTYAGWKNGWWNVVVVKHRVNGKTIFSSYPHLSKVDVKKGATVKPRTKVWEVWSTWNSTWNHLHFQIDTNEDLRNHPYYYYQNCPGNEWNNVNEGKCQKDLRNNTLDPLRFLETNGAIIKWGKVDVEESKPKAPRVDPSTLVTVKQINDREVLDFIRDHKINFSFNLWGTVPKGGQVKWSLTIKNKKGRPFTGRLPDSITFRANKELVNIFPNKLLTVDNGRRDITLTGLKTGKTTLYVDIGERTIYQKQLYIYDPKKKIIPKDVLDKSPSSVYLGTEKKGYFYFMDSNNVPLLDIPYSGEYQVTAKNGLLCPFNNRASNLTLEYNRTCGLGTLTNDMRFTYGWTNNWILIFGARPGSIWGMKITIKNLSTNKVLLEKVIKAKTPIGLSKYHTYYDEIMDLLEKSIVNGKNGHYSEDWDLDERDAYAFTRNLIIYKRNLYKDRDQKAYDLLNRALKEINKKKGTLNKKVTREQFLNIVTTFVPLVSKGTPIKYKDLDAQGNSRANKVFNSKYTWKDKFGNSYFQSDKNITRAEAAYVLYQALVNKTYEKDL